MNTSITNLLFLVMFVGFFAYFFTRKSISPPPPPPPEPQPQVLNDMVPPIQHDQLPEEVEIIQ